jgi:S1-C subfamily serine protease
LGGAAEATAVAPLHHWLGATLRDLVNRGRESTVVSNMELSDNRGILIKAVAPDSPAGRARLPADAVIVAANDVSIGDIAGLTSVLREAKGGDIRLKILTATGHIEITLATRGELPQPEAAAAPPASRRQKPARAK